MEIIREISSLEKDQVNHLRSQGYKKAQGFSVNTEAIHWNRSDDQSIVLGYFDGNELVSTMRAEIIMSQDVLEMKMECPWDYGAIEYPVMVLSKASTLESHKSKGLNAALRYFCLKIAMDWGVHHLIGTFIRNSPRTRSMKKMGYRFRENKMGWTNIDYFSKEPVDVAILDRKSFATAMTVSMELTRKDQLLNLWEGPQPMFRTVTVTK